MNLEQAKKVYKNKDLSGFVGADRSFTVHKEDSNLDAVTIYLPQPPDWGLIDNFSLDPKDQKFFRQEYPADLRLLEDDVLSYMQARAKKAKNDKATWQRILNATWDELDRNQRSMREEIEWIKKQWWHRIMGYWVFINGKPTYIDGWQYMFLNWWYMSDVPGFYPEYRDRDRRFFHYNRYAYMTTEGIASDESGEPVFEGGKPVVVHKGRRTLFGVMYVKHRRDGATHKYLCILFEIITSRTGVHGGIQSFDNSNAEEHYLNKLSPAWKKMPFFFKPIWRGDQAPREKLEFSNPYNEVRAELESLISYATTANKKFYDGKKQHAHLSDEGGKTVLEDFYARWNVVKPTLAQGANSLIHGFVGMPSTVADMEEEGGDKYEAMFMDSKFYNRNRTSGQTKTGVIPLFIPAYDGLEGFIGPYGESVIDRPTPEQAEYIGNEYGAREYIESVREDYVRDGSTKAMVKLREFKKLFPIDTDEAFSGGAGHAGFDIEALDKRDIELKKLPEYEKPYRVDLKWDIPEEPEPISAKEFIEKGYHTRVSEDGSWKVVAIPALNGRFEFSMRPAPEQTNLKVNHGGFWEPDYEKAINTFTSSADPFKFLDSKVAKEREDDSSLSLGGGTVFWDRNKDIDPPERLVSDWVSHRFVCDYEERPPSDDEYCEEMLMMSVFWGAKMFPEMNVEAVYKWFFKRGYAGYLKYAVDPFTGKLKSKPGMYSTGSGKQDIFNAIKRYVAIHVHREMHRRFVKQVREIKGPQEMTRYDLFTARGICLVGARYPSRDEDYDNESEDVQSLEDLVSVYSQ